MKDGKVIIDNEKKKKENTDSPSDHDSNDLLVTSKGIYFKIIYQIKNSLMIILRLTIRFYLRMLRQSRKFTH